MTPKQNRTDIPQGALDALKFYRLSEPGRKRLVSEESKWQRLAKAVALVIWPVSPEEK